MTIPSPCRLEHAVRNTKLIRERVHKFHCWKRRRANFNTKHCTDMKTICRVMPLAIGATYQTERYKHDGYWAIVVLTAGLTLQGDSGTIMPRIFDGVMLCIRGRRYFATVLGRPEGREIQLRWCFKLRYEKSCRPEARKIPAIQNSTSLHCKTWLDAARSMGYR